MFPIFLSNKKCGLEHVVTSCNKLTRYLIDEFFDGFSYKLQGPNIELHRYSMELHNIP